MLNSLDNACVYLASDFIDLRKSIDALSALVSQDFELDLFSHSLFVFCNRDRDRLKILYWDHNGFWLYYRRLERGKFRWPKRSDARTLCVSRRQLGWLLDGLTLEQHRAHAPVTAQIAV